MKRKGGKGVNHSYETNLPQLKRADVIFIRHKHSFFRNLLRRYMDHSYWDHTALVLYPRDLKRGREHTIICESIRRDFFGFFAIRSVAVHHLSFYLRDKEKFDVGIRRAIGLTEEERVLVTHIMLMNVDAPYWPWRKIRISLAAYIPRIKRYMQRRQRFSCSGIIQKAFYDAVPWEEKEKIVFKEGVWSPLELQELATPADLARTKKMRWIYNEK